MFKRPNTLREKNNNKKYTKKIKLLDIVRSAKTKIDIKPKKHKRQRF